MKKIAGRGARFRLFQWLKSKSLSFLKTIWKQLKDKTNIIIFIVVLAVLYAPTLLVGILGIIFRSGAMLAFAIMYVAFWLAPFTPFWTIVIALTFAIRKIVDRIKRKRR